MKFFLVTILSMFALTTHAQLSGGAVVAEGRDVLPETTFEVEGYNDGWALFSLAVDREGNVTSAQLEETNLKSSIDRIELKKHAMSLKFQPGTHFPKFHNAEVRITMVKSENPPQELEIIID
ncbi:MAG: hypothetical protein NXI10_16665 [bacterium]|nr:hypothetical protein [bacterium]